MQRQIQLTGLTRIARTAAQQGIAVSTVYTKPDRDAQHVFASSRAFNLGDETAGYLDGNHIIDIARREGCDAVHPGYGFLSENAAFARACTEAGLTFIGPPWQAIEDMGDKSRSKEIMTAAGIPCVPGYHGTNQDPAYLADQASQIGYPILIKAIKGGGGKGMRIARSAAEFENQLASAKSESRSAFGEGNDDVLIERNITRPRHVEVQVFADAHGNAVALGERDCSVQRRHQKILEESPAPGLPDALRKDLWAKARAAALAVGYRGAGTVEFILDNETGEFFFMEMNTRLQVEHPVTEMVTGTDLVEWQVMVARGEKLPASQEDIEAHIFSDRAGHAIEARIYAEIPEKGFIPDSGTLIHYRLPDVGVPGVRVDAGFVEGDTVSAHYDPMLAKLIAHGSDRPEALAKLSRALEAYEVAGVRVNIEFLKNVVNHPAFAEGQVETGFIEKYRDELFSPAGDLPDEVISQVALAMHLNAQAQSLRTDMQRLWASQTGFGMSAASRAYASHSIAFATQDLDPEAGDGADKLIVAHVTEQADGDFSVEVDGGRYHFIGSAPTVRRSTSSLATTVDLAVFTPRARLATTVVIPNNGSAADVDHATLTAFHRGRTYHLRTVQPAWANKLLAQRSAAAPRGSLRAPMPCKILRVEVAVGQRVAEGSSLVVVESMKMETVIRAPGPGDRVVKRVNHKAGVSALSLPFACLDYSPRLCSRPRFGLKNRIHGTARA
ncbi:hypothetical protein KEM52_000631 [Ascosphaera acerosa]|nr:hypothetical protein KEM52_000631 [Ascosphaera acerosa]